MTLRPDARVYPLSRACTTHTYYPDGAMSPLTHGCGTGLRGRGRGGAQRVQPDVRVEGAALA